MSVWAISRVKDEEDIVREAVGHMVGQVDHVFVSDNGSTDGTRDILEQLGVEVIDDPEVAYYQSQAMSRLAEYAREHGADWVVPFDADEIWHSPHGRIADVLAECEGVVAPAPILNYVAASDDDPDLPPLERIRWRRREALGLPKVACRAALPVTIEQGNHNAHYPSGIAHGLLEVHHFPYRSEEQFLSKVRNGAVAYAATSLPYGTGQHWREYGELLEREGPEAVKAWFREHFVSNDPESDPDLIYAPLP